MGALGDVGDLGVRALVLASVYPDAARCIATVVCVVDTSVLVVVKRVLMAVLCCPGGLMSLAL